MTKGLHKKTTAIVLAAGNGKRMKSREKKQFMLIAGKPILFYSLKAFQDSPLIDSIVLVTGADETERCRREITDRFLFDKVKVITAGGAERYDSVYLGLLKCESDTEIVFIHDGARPFVTEEIIARAYDAACRYRACTVGMKAKDTIRIADSSGFTLTTPDRKSVWQIQTPQVFEYQLALEAYTKLEENKSGRTGDGMTAERAPCEGAAKKLRAGFTDNAVMTEGKAHEAKGAAGELRSEGPTITDDAMVVEEFTGIKARLVEGSYDNIKITTPEDLIFGETIQKKKEISQL